METLKLNKAGEQNSSLFVHDEIMMCSRYKLENQDRAARIRDSEVIEQ